jgi:polyisoprenoid-binding protein YceI
MNKRFLLLAGLAAALASGARAETETYGIDATHSQVGFSIRHFVSKVPGKFTKFSGAITVDRADFTKSSAEATIDIASVDTGNEKRDAHLKSPDFFDAAKYPTMKFKSTAWKKTGENTFDVTGDLTLKDVTKPVTLKVTLLGFGPGMQGAKLSGWEATTTIDKKQWNVNDPAMLDAALGDDVTISLNIEANDKMK